MSNSPSQCPPWIWVSLLLAMKPDFAPPRDALTWALPSRAEKTFCILWHYLPITKPWGLYTLIKPHTEVDLLTQFILYRKKVTWLTRALQASWQSPFHLPNSWGPGTLCWCHFLPNPLPDHTGEPSKQHPKALLPTAIAFFLSCFSWYPEERKKKKIKATWNHSTFPMRK